MKYACYTCGYAMGDGIPPMEALGKKQAACVGGVLDMDERYTTLEGTPYEGMSTYSFCGYCLTMIRDFPKAQFSKQKLDGHKMGMRRPNLDFTGMYVWCECGADHAFTATMGRDPQVLANRWMVRHYAEIMYPGADYPDMFMDY